MNLWTGSFFWDEFHVTITIIYLFIYWFFLKNKFEKKLQKKIGKNCQTFETKKIERKNPALDWVNI
jgi:hypothetical protein